MSKSRFRIFSAYCVNTFYRTNTNAEQKMTEKKPIIVKRFMEYISQMKNDEDAPTLKP
jgi:hypothetical protein